MKKLLFGLLCCSLVTALPSSTGLGVYFENGNEETALLKLDYGTYRAIYNATSDVSSRFCFGSRSDLTTY